MPSPEDEKLAVLATEVVQAAGRRMKLRFSRDARPADRAAINAAIGINDEGSLGVLRAGLDNIKAIAERAG